VKTFNMNGHTFLAFANYYAGSKYKIDSFIYKWNGSEFVLFESLPTRGARAWHPFVMRSVCGQTFLGVANYKGDSQGYNTKSVIYRVSGSKFIEFQEISTLGAHNLTSFKYKGTTYLAVANEKINHRRYNINNMLYILT